METLRKFWEKNLKEVISYSAFYTALKRHGILEELVKKGILTARGIKKKSYRVANEEKLIKVLKDYGYWRV